jgi:hypothetical protein
VIVALASGVTTDVTTDVIGGPAPELAGMIAAGAASAVVLPELLVSAAVAAEVEAAEVEAAEVEAAEVEAAEVDAAGAAALGAPPEPVCVGAVDVGGVGVGAVGVGAVGVVDGAVVGAMAPAIAVTAAIGTSQSPAVSTIEPSTKRAAVTVCVCDLPSASLNVTLLPMTDPANVNRSVSPELLSAVEISLSLSTTLSCADCEIIADASIGLLGSWFFS